jgi:hypothetical protein
MLGDKAYDSAELRDELRLAPPKARRFDDVPCSPYPLRRNG